jgi:ankyrin repeat protein
MEAKIAKSVDDCRKETAAHGAAEVEFLLKFVVNENKRHPWKPHKIQYASAALVLAAAQGHTNVVKVLIDGLNACQVNAAIRVGDGKTTALHAAAITGQMEVVTLLLEHYTSECIDRVDAAGYTALHQASHKGDARIVNALLEANANINAADKRGKTALYLAASADHAEVVQLLLRRGADRKLRGGTAQLTALEVAVERGCNAVLPLLQDDKILFGETQDSRGQSQPVSQDTPQDSEPSKPPKVWTVARLWGSPSDL